ncbi:FixH family protein [Litchfieldia alkalitelluris]|uniref:FixH family protein n=1 Tax=Litchfieldia alkalitelluris TaxID=304268 RepID=UPI0009972F0B|nr:FixH family protein [Litchfieldia alkalitelluris]
MKQILLSLGLCLLLIGCSSQPHTPKMEDLQKELIDVTLKINPSGSTGTVLEVYLNQEGDEVNDAEVMVDLWQTGKKAEMTTVKASHLGKGIYEVLLPIGEIQPYEGVYHVTSRGQHVMDGFSITFKEGEPVVNER